MKIPPPSIPAQLKPEAEGLLCEGNRLYDRNDFGGAVEAYTQGLVFDPKSGVLYAHRAKAYLGWTRASSLTEMRPQKEICDLRLEYKLQAVKDAHRATDLEPKWATSWMRIAEALKALLAEEDSVNATPAVKDELTRIKIVNGIRAALENGALFTKCTYSELCYVLNE
ncbi:hypothetical protein D9757_007654 [Collybiopsis confluens]|uniref:Uncharacterized protein n=1 Tax=Collybiopsis confluens TaxID=2823264 RepID=A0A8H5H9S6_9AGAR|nr:hypothetical protein D9757_007654 [Collybiopsis confluens]